jgi:hypothetical protein
MDSAIEDSAIGFQICEGASEADFASQLAQLFVSLGSRQQLQAGSDGLSDTSAAGLLRLFQKVLRDFDRNFTRCTHDEPLYHT